MNPVFRTLRASLMWKRCGRPTGSWLGFPVNPTPSPSPAGWVCRKASSGMRKDASEPRAGVLKQPSRSWSRPASPWSATEPKRNACAKKPRKKRRKLPCCAQSSPYAWRRPKSKPAAMRSGFSTRRVKQPTASMPNWTRCAGASTTNRKRRKSTVPVRSFGGA